MVIILFFLLAIISLNSSVQMDNATSVSTIPSTGTVTQTSTESEKKLDPFLMYAIAQVSAVFVAITAGLYTNKLISISDQKNRLKTKINEFDREINEQEIVLSETIAEINRLKLNHAYFWAEHFVDSLEHKSGLKEFTLDELKDEFDKSDYGPMNEYYEQAFNERYGEFLEKIKEFLGPDKGLFGLNLTALRSAELIAEDRRARREEEDKIIDLVSQKRIDEHNIKFSKKMIDSINSEIKLITLPTGLAKEFFMLFIFAVLGVVFPLMFEYWSPHTGLLHPHIVALSAFMIGLTLNLFFIGAEAIRITRKED